MTTRASVTGLAFLMCLELVTPFRGWGAESTAAPSSSPWERIRAAADSLLVLNRPALVRALPYPVVGPAYKQRVRETILARTTGDEKAYRDALTDCDLAARLAQKGDLVIIVAYARMEEAEAKSFTPRVLLVDSANRAMAPSLRILET